MLGTIRRASLTEPGKATLDPCLMTRATQPFEYFLMVCRVFALAAMLLIASVAQAEPKVSALALFKGKAVLSIDGKQRVLKIGASSPEGVELVAADSERAIIRIDEREFELRLDGKISGSFPAGPAPKIVRLMPAEGGHYFVDGQINGNPVRFLVDTGATSVAMNKHMARRLGIAYMVDGKNSMVRTASGTAVAYGITLDEVKIRSLRLKRVKGTVIDGDFPGETLLGQSFLNRLDIHRKGVVLELRER